MNPELTSKDKQQQTGPGFIAGIFAILMLVSAAILYFIIPGQNIPAYIVLTLLFAAAVTPLVLLSKRNDVLVKRNRHLAAQQQFITNAVNQANEGIIVTGGNTGIEYMNTVAEKITGKSLLQVRHKQLSEIYNPENQKTGLPAESIVSRVLTTGQSVVNENNTVITNSNREKIIITNSCSPVYDEAGNINGTVLVFKDTTQSYTGGTGLNTAVKEETSLIQYLPQAAYTCDKNGYIQSYNKAAAVLWGRKPQLNKEKWCGALKLFYADGSPMLHEDSPMAITIKQQKALDNAEVLLEQPNGNRRQVRLHPVPVFTAYGQLTGGLNLLIDITEKKEHEALAAFNEDKYRTLVEQASEAIFIADVNGTLLEVNEQASVMTGYTREELKCSNIARLFPKTDFENNLKVFKKLSEKGEKIAKEFAALHKNKSLLSVYISAKKLSDGRMMAIVKDITGLKQTEKSLYESEQLNASILTSVTSQIAVINETGIVVTTNRAWSDFESRYGKTVLERCAPGQNLIAGAGLDAANGDKTARVFLDGIDAVRTKKIPLFEYEYTCYTGGRLQWFFVRITPFADNTSKLVISHVDITDLKNAVNETGNYRFALDQSSIVDVSDSNGVITYVNDNFCAISGYSREEITGQTHKFLNSGHHTPGFYKNMWDTIIDGKVWSGEVQNRNKQGGIFWVNTTIVPFLNTEGKPIQFISIRTDISQRKAALEKMHSAVERFHFLVQATSDTIWDWDIENDKILYNEGVSKVFGYKKQEISNVKKWWQNCIHSADITPVNEAINEAFENKKQHLQLEYRFLSSDGSYKYIFDRAFILYNEKGNPYRIIGAMQDITYKKEEEQRISKAVVDAQEAERQYLGMELHDNINQLLTGTLLMLGAATHTTMKKDAIVKIVENCKQHLGSAVEEIRNLSHRLSPAAFTTSLQHELITLITEMNRASSFVITHQLNGINEKLLAPEIKICLYRILQEQLSNINKHSKAKHVNIALLQNNSSITLKITDDGVGFNPRLPSEGIGLGNIKKRIGYFSGKFTLSTTPGNGCCIEAELPLQGSLK